MTVNSSSPPLPPLKSVKVLDQLRERIRYLHYSIRTEDVYVYWVCIFIRFHGRRHPATMGAIEVEAFLLPRSGRSRTSLLRGLIGCKGSP
jgi:hypothetical protein